MEHLLVQWFFTVWVSGIPHNIGPFVNDIQCENNVSAYMDGGPYVGIKPYYSKPTYRPMCVKHEFRIAGNQEPPK